MSTIYAELILSPTDHYIVRPRLYRPSNTALSRSGSSALTFALSSKHSKAVRITLDKHDQACLEIAERYREFDPVRYASVQATYHRLQADFINGIHLRIDLPVASPGNLNVPISLVLPTALGVGTWQISTLETVLQPRPITKHMEPVFVPRGQDFDDIPPWI